jgi:hypothetical protein
VHFLRPLLRSHALPARLGIAGRDVQVAADIETAFDSAARKKGLLGRNALPEGVALVIAPTQAIHTFGMRFPIDVIFAARDGRVVKLRRAIPPSRVSGAVRAFAVVEMAAGAIDRAGIKVGDHLIVREDSAHGS